MSTLVFLFADGVATLLVARLLSGVAACPDRSRPGNADGRAGEVFHGQAQVGHSGAEHAQEALHRLEPTDRHCQVGERRSRSG